MKRPAYTSSPVGLAVAVLTILLTGNFVLTAGKAVATDLPESDKDFMVNAAEYSMAEIQLSQIAVQRSTIPEIKSLANLLITDHTKLLNSLRQLGAQRNVALPVDINSGHRSTLAKMQAMNGMRFNRTFINQVIDDQTKLGKVWLPESREGTHDIRVWAISTISAVQRHLGLAHDVARDIEPGEYNSVDDANVNK